MPLTLVPHQGADILLTEDFNVCFFNKGIKASLLAGALAAVPTVANASTMLKADDFVGISFWTISMAMVAATVFFLMEAGRMSGKWKTSMTVGALVTLVAAVHYFYMRDVWASGGGTPTVYRYVDWLITVPLQMVEFYFILAAVTVVSAGIFWRLMIGSLVMLVAGYMGEAGMINAWAGFIVGMLGWAYILYEIFAGEAGRVSAEKAPASVQSAFGTMRLIVTIGWAIYPLGYFLGYLNGSADAVTLNVIYNVADVVNKIAFVGIIWAAANAETK
jgi:bacteriorhodopsin